MPTTEGFMSFANNSSRGVAPWWSAQAVVLVLLASSIALAQTSSSLIQGTITDSSGAPVPNARVTATLANTETNYSTVTNESGNYVLPDVRPGEYSISAVAIS